MTPLHHKLISVVEPVCQHAGYELVDLRFVLEQGGWVLRICIDLPLDPAVPPSEVPVDRVDLEDCENLSRELSAVLDVDDPIPQAYSLEVGSPGIDRPLRTAQHYTYFAGSEARIQLSVGLTGAGTVPRKNFRGILGGATESGTHVKITVDGQPFELPIDDIEHARLIPDWDAVMRGGSGFGQATTNPSRPDKKAAKRGA
jgi:ribosome maturation factor RimP